MKKKILILLFACCLFYESSAYITFYGQYRRISPTSFFCALISTQFCARVQEPPEEPFQWWPHRTRITTFGAGGVVQDDFEVIDYKITREGEGHLVNYTPVELP